MNCLHRWRKWIRPLVILVYICIMVIALSLLIVELYRKDTPDHVKGWFVGGIFALMSLPISLWGILQHLVYFTQPVLQKNIIRVLWMVPVYALNAWLALLFPKAAIYLDTIRECYEAYVIYNFMSFLLNYLRQDHPYLEYDLENKQQVKHFFPFCLLPPWPMGRPFVERCKHGVLQYTIVTPMTTVIALFCEFGDKYDEGDFNFTSAWSYLVIINNVSQIWAMYCLVLFYKLTKEELKPLKPLPKFMCVKAVVFLSFWQSVVIAALAEIGAIPQQGPWLFYHSIKEVATGLQDFCICIEMFFAAIAHYYSFSHKPYMDMAADRSSCCSSFLSMWDVSDVHSDVMEHARFIGTGVQRKLRNKFRSRGDEREPLLTNNQQPERSAQQIMVEGRPHTPPIIVHDEFMASMKSETQTEWDGSSIDQQDSFVNQDQRGTASLNNYADFSTSVEVTQVKEFERQTLSAKSETPSEEKLIDFETGNSDINNVETFTSVQKEETCSNKSSVKEEKEMVESSKEEKDTVESANEEKETVESAKEEIETLESAKEEIETVESESQNKQNQSK
ncbi:hypothetical protein SNE40_016273 [Patella caerulea]|uniref:Transmembrane protein 184C n=1 Tax=Patella caerulea TaxID=87958 RepID=A0AAN8J9M1_PATCE